MNTDIQKRYRESVESDARRKSVKKEARNEYSRRFFTYISSSFLCVSYLGFASAASYFISFASMPAAVVFWFFACFPAVNGMMAFCESIIENGKRDFGVIFSFLYSPGNFVAEFGKTLKAAVTLIWALTPFFISSFVPKKYGIGEKYGLLFEIVSVFLLFYGVFYWLAYTFHHKTDRESVSFAFSFLPHIILIYLTNGVWLVPFLPYASLTLAYSRKK